MPRPCDESQETIQSQNDASDALSLTELPGASKLLTDYLKDFNRVAEFYSIVGTDLQSLEDAAPRIAAQGYDREALVDALTIQNRRFGSGELTFRYLEELRSPDSVAIVSGQQAGLFTGPLYTVMKAVSIARLTECVRERGIKAVPVFWVASEDHDFAEVNHCRVVAPDGGLTTVSLESCPAPQAQPVGHIHLCAEITSYVDQFLKALPDTEFKKEIADLLHRTYKPGAGFAEAFSKVMARLFAEYGIILLDPLDEKLKALCSETFATTLKKSPELVNAVIDQSEQLLQRGYHAQVHVEADAVPLFVIQDGRREALTRKNGSFYIKHSKRIFGTVEETAKLAQEDPSKFSPNVTLRPVVQDTLLPTLIYLAGPSELAYFAQIKPIYQMLGRIEPKIVVRGGGTVIDPKTAKTLKKYNLKLQDFFVGTEPLFKKVVEEVIDHGTAEAFDEATSNIEKELDRLRLALNQVDPTIAAALDKRRKKIEYHLTNLRGKYVRSRTQQDEMARQRILTAQSILYPNGDLQEREINVFYFIAHRGFGVIDEIYKSLQVGAGLHQLITLDA
ncbi:MAG TPA: bacillithiol biosynthesis cysteine-adding enzyme BshC [Blastocatellia bacterium]|nr:bacillithiol biosynthesis cysteine-adding enzyme BshC [Blastocatellia bacterium]